MSTVDTDLIAEALAAFQGEDLDGRAGARIDEEVVELHRSPTRLEAEQLRRLGEWDRQRAVGPRRLQVGRRRPGPAVRHRPGHARERLRLAAPACGGARVPAAFGRGDTDAGQGPPAHHARR